MPADRGSGAAGQQVRETEGVGSVPVAGETAFGPWLMEQAVAVRLTTEPLNEPLATRSVSLDAASVDVEIEIASSNESLQTAQ